MPEEKVKHVASKEEFDEIIKGKKPVLVDFFATWCGPCQMMGPILDEMAESYKNFDKVSIVKVDIDMLAKVAAEYNVMSVPTFILFKNGKAEETMVGMRPRQELEDKLDEALKDA